MELSAKETKQVCVRIQVQLHGGWSGTENYWNKGVGEMREEQGTLHLLNKWPHEEVSLDTWVSSQVPVSASAPLGAHLASHLLAPFCPL